MVCERVVRALGKGIKQVEREPEVGVGAGVSLDRKVWLSLIKK